MIVSLVGLFPISVRIAERKFFSKKFHTGWQYEWPVLLVWSDDVEIRWCKDLSEISSHPKDATYTFVVAPEERGWVAREVGRIPTAGDGGWMVDVKQLDPLTQQIQFGTARRRFDWVGL